MIALYIYIFAERKKLTRTVDYSFLWKYNYTMYIYSYSLRHIFSENRTYSNTLGFKLIVLTMPTKPLTWLGILLMYITF